MRKQILLFLGVPTLALAQLTAGVQTYSVRGEAMMLQHHLTIIPLKNILSYSSYTLLIKIEPK
ncbi:hypothetical protein [Riemerella anatipestifer]|uniref:hypothetical protein n=1 Tax=Riemerella anatipestifer TaxID=34085 RepID=UPI0021F85C53|nr:hypothetical protein [Riemerella anatipestifer]MCW0491830.1 hypothetical protein [Riemerella anatipestifer]MDR7749417.1 hypothetical protein [Riemerella anatipestifer]MDR7751492.1 hypothetical protein [Riemerella anatipestifer]MDR7754962.1 hypothetical protein [Riemerella anatipestifer]MDR7757983.1 hypothetical protein [Riemerella anatipestifer]